eukprot:3426921-Pleurochrysis_carterae.AAC.2
MQVVCLSARLVRACALARARVRPRSLSILGRELRSTRRCTCAPERSHQMESPATATASAPRSRRLTHTRTHARTPARTRTLARARARSHARAHAHCPPSATAPLPPPTVTPLSSGCDDALQVDRDSYETRLLQVKGARSVRVNEVPLSASSLNAGARRTRGSPMQSRCSEPLHRLSRRSELSI